MGGLPANRTVNGFAVDPKDPKVMYVAMRDGLFKSADGGARWKAVGNELKNLAAVAVNPKRGAEIYVSTMDGTVFVSGAGGQSWRRQP